MQVQNWTMPLKTKNKTFYKNNKTFFIFYKNKTFFYKKRLTA